jgi:hypothetical protein
MDVHAPSQKKLQNQQMAKVSCLVNRSLAIPAARSMRHCPPLSQHSSHSSSPGNNHNCIKHPASTALVVNPQPNTACNRNLNRSRQLHRRNKRQRRRAYQQHSLVLSMHVRAPSYKKLQNRQMASHSSQVNRSPTTPAARSMRHCPPLSQHSSHSSSPGNNHTTIKHPASTALVVNPQPNTTCNRNLNRSHELHRCNKRQRRRA